MRRALFEKSRVTGLLLGAALALGGTPAWAQPAVAEARLEPIRFTGEIVEDEQLSAAGAAGNLLLIAADEGAAVQVLEKDGEGYRFKGQVKVLADDEEADLEALAVRPASGEPLTAFAVGCHCLNRKKAKDKETAAANRERIAGAKAVEEEESRAHVFRLTLDPRTGEKKKVEMGSLTAVLDSEPLLQRFRQIPSKENGIDLEGLALAPDGRLVAGFRGPVLRENFVPVLVFDFDKPKEKHELRFVRLGGLGIRDLAAVEGGFLLLAGPVGDGAPDYRLFFWNGADDVPGKDRPHGNPAVELTRITPPSADAKAEGLAVLDESADRWELLLLFDGAPKGGPARLTVAKPGRT